MKEKLLLCVLFSVTYKCDSYGPKSPGILGSLFSGAQEVGANVQGILEGIAQGGLNFQGHVQVNSQQAQQNYHKPQVPSNYGGSRPEKPVDTILVIVEESPQQNLPRPPGQYGQGQYGQGQYGQGQYGYRPPNNYNKPNYPHNPGYNDYGGNHNNGPWNSGNGHRPHHHHRPGYGYGHQGHNHHNGNYNGNQIPFEGANNYGDNTYQNPNENVPVNEPNRPFDRPINNNFGNKPTEQPNRPFDKPINNNFGSKPTDQPNRPFDRPINNNNNFGNIPTGQTNEPLDKPFNNNFGNTDSPQRPFDKPFNSNHQGIPTSLPTQGEPEYPSKPSNDVITKRPDQMGSAYNPNNENKKPVSTTENAVYNVDKSTKTPDDDDLPLFVPLNPNEYVYGGDKIEIHAPKRETNDKPKPAEEDYSDSNIDPLDVRFGDKTQE